MAVISVYLKSVVVALIIDVKITKNQHKVFLLSSCIKVSQSVRVVHSCNNCFHYPRIVGLILVLTFDYLQFTFWNWQFIRLIQLFCHK